MSGPKSGNYCVTGRAAREIDVEIRAMIEAQRRYREKERQKREAEQRKIKKLEQEIKYEKANLYKLKNNIKINVDSLLSEAKKLLPDSSNIKNVENLVNEIYAKADKFPLNYSEQSSKSMSLYLNKIKALREDIISNEYNILKVYVETLKQEIKEHKQLNAENKFLSTAKSLNRKPIDNFAWKEPVPVSQVNEETFNRLEQRPGDKDIKKELQELTENCFQLVSFYLTNDLIADKSQLRVFEETINEILSDRTTDIVYKRDVIKKLMKSFIAVEAKKYDKEIKENSKKKEEFYNLLDDYISLYQILGEKNKTFKFQIDNSDDILSELKQLVKQLKVKLKSRKEREYVSKSINEVMQELGYELIVSDYIDDGEIRHNIYQFERGNVINAYTSDNGSIMLEVTGVKKNEELSGYEITKIVEGMEKFCNKYDTIKQKLKDKGIELARENLREADERYAKAIDLRDYNIDYKEQGGMKRGNITKVNQINGQ